MGLQFVGTQQHNIGVLLSAVGLGPAFYPLIKDQLRARRRSPLQPPAGLTVGIPDVDLYWHPLVVLAARGDMLSVREALA